MLALAPIGQPMPDMHMLPTAPVYVRPKLRTRQAALHGAFPASDVALLAWLDPAACCEGQTSNDIWGYTDASTGREYALMLYRTGLAVVDVTSPSAVAVVGRVASPPSQWKDIKVYQHFAFLVTENATAASQLVVVDLAAVSSGHVTVVQNTTLASAGIASTHNVAIDETVPMYEGRGEMGCEMCDVGCRILHLKSLLHRL
jgi:choice-of-anchor B domain-containing protein